MADRRVTDSAERVEVRRRMNDHETMTVEVAASNEVRHIVAYESPSLRTTLARLPAGSTVPVEMRRAGARANVWRAVALGPSRERSTASTPADDASTADRTVSNTPERPPSRSEQTPSERTRPPSERASSPVVTE